jgi:hypothetical protein
MIELNFNVEVIDGYSPTIEMFSKIRGFSSPRAHIFAMLYFI